MSGFGRSLCWLCALVALTQCHRQPEPEGGALTAPPTSASPLLPTASAAGAASAASVELAASTEPAVDPKSAASLGEWIEASLYDFKVVAIHRCPAVALSPGSQTAPTTSGAPFRIGVVVQIRAKVDPLLASTRDITLEHAGVILQAELNPSPACGAPLPTKQLRKGEAALGEVVFTLPDAEFASALALHFKPTRWGGAPTVSFDMPQCLADCAPAKPAQTRNRIADSAPRSKTR